MNHHHHHLIFFLSLGNRSGQLIYYMIHSTHPTMQRPQPSQHHHLIIDRSTYSARRKTMVLLVSQEGSSYDASSINRPRNHLVTDATQPFRFTFQQYGKPKSIVVHQTPDEETWPGGALWDIGVLLSQFFVSLAEGFDCESSLANKAKLPSRLLQAIPSTKDLSILELGCGVGLTGIVAAAVLGTQLTILTDLKVVVDEAAEPNLVRNTTASTGKHPYRLTEAGKRGRILAMPLCWGDADDEQAVAEALLSWTKPCKTSRNKKKGAPSPRDYSQPDLIVIGDVAYQHKPGAPSHFDALVSTLLKFLGPHTRVIFGTRMRMPASADLLELFSKHMEEVVSPPVAADEIDPSFGKFKHQITIHVFRKK
jgi:predicted nicotinamide N-methyase